MSLFLPFKRATLLVPSGPEHDPQRKHLFILLTDPIGDDAGTPVVAMASLSSIKQGLPHDPSCVLHPGDHPFVKHESYVLYARARIEAVDKLLRGIQDGKLERHIPMDTTVFAKICRGLEISRNTPAKVLAFYRRGLSQ